MFTGSQLKDLIKEKETNVRQISKISGIPASTLYSIIHKDSKIRDDYKLKIVKALGLNYDEYVEMFNIPDLSQYSELLNSTLEAVCKISKIKFIQHCFVPYLKESDIPFELVDTVISSIKGFSEAEKDLCLYYYHSED